MVISNLITMIVPTAKSGTDEPKTNEDAKSDVDADIITMT